MIILPGIPLFWAVAPVRFHEFLGVFGSFRVWRVLEGGGGWVDQDWW